jgi:ribonuclease P/MRP protein subunit RPP40
MYADDTKLFRQVDDDIDRRELQEDLDRLASWAKEWQLKFNVAKCKVMHIGVKNEKVKLTMSDGAKRSELQETELEKDLGIWFNSRLTSQDQVTHAVNKANQILGLIRRSFTYMDAQLMKQLFTTMVRPHLEYGNVVWHPYLRQEIDMIEAVQHRATKIVPGYSKLSYEKRLRKMKLPTLEYRRFRGDMIEVCLYRVDESTLLPRHRDAGMKTRGHCLKLEK